MAETWNRGKVKLYERKMFVKWVNDKRELARPERKFLFSLCCAIGAFLVVALAILIAPGGVPGIGCVFGHFLIFDLGNDFDPVFSLLCVDDLWFFESEAFYYDGNYLLPDRDRRDLFRSRSSRLLLSSRRDSFWALRSNRSFLSSISKFLLIIWTLFRVLPFLICCWIWSMFFWNFCIVSLSALWVSNSSFLASISSWKYF